MATAQVEQQTHGQYRVILADPPWQYRVFDNASASYGAARASYPTQDFTTLCTLPVRNLAAKNAALFLWVTSPWLDRAPDLMRTWGFRYVTVAFTWVKIYRSGKPYCGLGHYTRSATELCLLGLRGAMKRRDATVLQVLTAPVTRHSRKPDQQYERIMRLFDGPYVELFSRQCWPGWDTALSNQSDKFPAQPFLFGEESA